MIPTFDIFKIDKDGHLIWCAAAANLDEANSEARARARADKGNYVIFNQKTGTRSIIGPGFLDGGIHTEALP